MLNIDYEAKTIVSSGYADDPILLSEYKKYGFMVVVAKPYEIQEFSEVLGKIMRES